MRKDRKQSKGSKSNFEVQREIRLQVKKEKGMENKFKGKSKTATNNRFPSAVGDEDDDDKKLIFLDLQFGPRNVLIDSSNPTQLTSVSK